MKGLAGIDSVLASFLLSWRGLGVGLSDLSGSPRLGGEGLNGETERLLCGLVVVRFTGLMAFAVLVCCDLRVSRTGDRGDPGGVSSMTMGSSEVAADLVMILVWLALGLRCKPAIVQGLTQASGL